MRQDGVGPEPVPLVGVAKRLGAADLALAVLPQDGGRRLGLVHQRGGPRPHHELFLPISPAPLLLLGRRPLQRRKTPHFMHFFSKN